MTSIEVYHYSLCPFSRKLRIILREKEIAFELVQELFWQRRKDFLKMCPTAQPPLVVLPGGIKLWGNNAICEYLEEIEPGLCLTLKTPEGRALVRQVGEWFDVKFYTEVTKYIFYEKIIKTVAKTGYPDSRAIQAAKTNLGHHMQYIEFLCRKQQYLAAEEPTTADFAAAAQLSVLDYVGDVQWGNYPIAKQWYALIKSRPSFKPLLNERIANFSPPAHYGDPDF
jgi:glutathione S-transferase